MTGRRTAAARPTTVVADDDLAALDATATAAAVRSGEVSALEVVEAAIARAERLDPWLGAVVVDDLDRARHRAAATPPGPFAGVPFYVKDNVDVAGLPTRYGTPALAGARAATATHELVTHLEAMGLVVLGKSTLPEFGFSSSCERVSGTATRNPWNTAHTTGGSSSGSAALVAAGVVPVAHAVDGGGSIRIPAACCGLVGLKPTRGRLVPSEEARKLPVDILGEGLLTRTVRDTATFLVEAERFHRDPSLEPLGDVHRSPGRRLRVGLLAESPAGGPVDAPTRAAVEDTAAVLEDLGHRVEPVELPDVDRFAEDFLQYWSMLAFSVVTAGRRLYDPSFDRRRLTPFTHAMARRFRRSAWRAPSNLVRMRRAAASYAHVHEQVDVVLSPTVTTVAPPLGHLAEDLPAELLLGRTRRWVAFTPLANATGTPAITLPMGHDGVTGLPVGVMLGAGHGGDGLLLSLASELEDARPFRRPSAAVS